MIRFILVGMGVMVFVQAPGDSIKSIMPTEDKRQPECPKKSRLMDQYSAAIAEFSRTAAIVNMRMGVMYKGDYDRLTKAVDEARVLTEKAHRELIAHIEEHGC